MSTFTPFCPHASWCAKSVRLTLLQYCLFDAPCSLVGKEKLKPLNHQAVWKEGATNRNPSYARPTVLPRGEPARSWIALRQFVSFYLLPSSSSQEFPCLAHRLVKAGGKQRTSLLRAERRRNLLGICLCGLSNRPDTQ